MLLLRLNIKSKERYKTFKDFCNINKYLCFACSSIILNLFMKCNVNTEICHVIILTLFSTSDQFCVNNKICIGSVSLNMELCGGI